MAPLNFEYIGEINYIFETDVGQESEEFVGCFTFKVRGKKSHASVPLKLSYEFLKTRILFTLIF